MSNKVSIKEIAKLSGVSASTVSRVINNNGRFSEETKQRVLATIKKYNYQTNSFAKGLRMQRSNTIGIIVPDLANTFFSSLVEKIENNFFSNNYSTIICDTGRNSQKEMTYLQMLESKQIDGLIVISGDNPFNTKILSRDIPVVCIDREPKNQDTIYVGSDHYMGAKIATQTLIKADTQPLLFTIVGSSSSIKHRIKGFKDTIKSLNLNSKIDNSIFYLNSTYKQGSDERRLEIRTILRDLVQKQKLPLGIFATSDTLAADILVSARDLRLNIPGDVKIIGFDDAPIAKYSFPELTTIRQNVAEIALRASQHLIKAIKSEDTKLVSSEHDIIPVNLIERSTL
ncbi:transcriptional regulator, LacI family [Lactobacillus bombicola]|uniref:Transcriptional regulator, LacI family n=1 Tax=Lactobacillus bombicola TaxID=1505723 RepID=A0A1I1RN68_9LACO|nr:MULTISPECIES: LacI family DNA-binding transcriptional regulator [Lactobacillus]RMC38530.1 LacI family transcriptional regulator [Lactobacillus sp. ESL0237]RMC42875.1 LacI family transcriptional regulator [Lactobacillus sp. ESL0234]RMC43729.1 LacI family transcriptional regulator [Lactobacillus sp. ESL0236]SFD35734.1 transcriptional regulator, LacI family [Lactobacillus bombicola]